MSQSPKVSERTVLEILYMASADWYTAYELCLAAYGEQANAQSRIRDFLFRLNLLLIKGMAKERWFLSGDGGRIYVFQISGSGVACFMHRPKKKDPPGTQTPECYLG